MNFDIPSTIDQLCTANVNITVNFARLSAVTKNRLIKTLEQGFSTFGYGTIVYDLLELLEIKIHYAPVYQYQGLSEEDKHVFRALCAAAGYRITRNNYYSFRLEPIQQPKDPYYRQETNPIYNKLIKQLEKMVTKPVHPTALQEKIDNVLKLIKANGFYRQSQVILR